MGGHEAALAAGPAALAPASLKAQLIGEVSPAAQPHGVRKGMRLGEALTRCPQLRVVPADPVAVSEHWEKVLCSLESIGARVEDGGAGLAFIPADELRRLHGGSRARDNSTNVWWLDGIVTAIRDALVTPARIGAGPSRFCAFAGAFRARSRRAELIDGEGQLAAEPLILLRERESVAAVVDPLLRMGLETLGDLARIPRSKLSDRFGLAGERAHDLARGRDTPLIPREPSERMRETLRLPESALGDQLQRALGLLVDRLLARPERKGRSFRALVIEARLVEGGTWRERVVLRESLTDEARIKLALGSRIALLPAPAEAIRLSVTQFGSGTQATAALFDDGAMQRRARLREGVQQARAAAGPDAALRVVEIDPESRVPERRALLTPHEF
ncbi:MAG TPA: hypothetical protein VNT22_06990 [Baekduia sp.]|nr:hypothetical protein [Baekduia sp.]